MFKKKNLWNHSTKQKYQKKNLILNVRISRQQKGTTPDKRGMSEKKNNKINGEHSFKWIE